MQRPLKIPLSYFIAISASGIGIGILVGLSASPVVNSLLAGILTVVAGVVGALCGVSIEQSKPDAKLVEKPSENENKDQGPQFEWDALRVSPVPMGVLVIAIVAGSLVGLYARTHQWFAESPKHLVEKWQKSTDLSTQEIARRLFYSIYGTTKVEGKTEEPKNDEAILTLLRVLAQSEKANKDVTSSQPIHAGVLFEVSEEMCEHLRTLEPKELRLELQGLGYPTIKEFVNRCKDDEVLRLAFDLLICPKEK